MKRYLRLLGLLAVATTAACASPATVPGGSSVMSQPAAQAAARPNDYGNIRWNKSTIHVYKSKASTATLTFWARDGYFTYPMTCQNGSKVTATPGTVHGNPNRYDHVKFSFVVKTAKADQCYYTAVLNNTGSPPLTTIEIYLNQ
jgi:hypothetical protein